MYHRYFVLTKQLSDDGKPLYQEILGIGGSPYIDSEYVVPMETIEPGDHTTFINGPNDDDLTFNYRPIPFNALDVDGNILATVYACDPFSALTLARMKVGDSRIRVERSVVNEKYIKKTEGH